MRAQYLAAVSLIERLHRTYLDVVKAELDRLGVDDINNVQCLILYNIGSDELTVGELTQRGCYLGTNVTYNLRKLIDADYVTQQRSPRDRRSVRVKLSKKGADLFRRLDSVFESHAEDLADRTEATDMTRAIDRMRALQEYWEDRLALGSGASRRPRRAA